MARTLSGPHDPNSGVRIEPHPFQLELDELRRRVEALEKSLRQTQINLTYTRNSGHGY